MVAGHLDEVGFMITQIDDKGFLRFQTVGGWWSQVMLAQRVTIVTRKGDVTGVIGSKPPHILPPEARKSQLKLKTCSSILVLLAKKKQWRGVRPGDQVVPYFEFQVMKNEKCYLQKHGITELVVQLQLTY